MSKPENPFKGLRSYTREDYGRLFGRDADFILMKDRIFAARTTLLFAGSGVGKTSFFQAKVIPELERRHPVPLQIRYHREWSAADPLEAVRGTLGADSSQHLTDFFERRPGQWIVVLDQFEEIFQNPDYWTRSAALRDEIAAVVGSSLPVSIVISMREEFLGRLSFFDNIIPDVFRNYYRLQNPDLTTTEDIIFGTCGSIPVDGAGAAALVRDMAQVEIPGAGAGPRYASRNAVFLPFLQLVCRTLWEEQKEGADGVFEFLSGYAQSRDADGSAPPARILESFCASRLERLPAGERLMAGRALDYLVTSQGAKRAYAVSDLADLMHVRNKALLGKMLTALKDEGILRGWRRQSDEWFELSHDMYAPILYRWKEAFQARRARRMRRKVAAALTAAAALVVVAFVWSHIQATKTLAATLDQRAAYTELQQDLDSAIILRMAALEADPTDARRRAAAAVAFPPEQLDFTLRHEGPVTAMAYSAGGEYVVTASGAGGEDPAEGAGYPRPRVQTVLEFWEAATGKPKGGPWPLSSAATLIAAAHPDLVATAKTDGSTSNSTSIIEIWRRDRKSAIALLHLECGLDRMEFNAAGTSLLTVCLPSGGDYPWAVFDLEGRPVIESHKSLQIGFAPSGDKLVAAYVSGEVEEWNTYSGKLLRKLPHQQNQSSKIAFTPDAKTFAVADLGGAVRLYDAVSGRPAGELEAGTTVRRMAFSSDGRRLLAVRDRDATGPIHIGYFTTWDLDSGQSRSVAVEEGSGPTWFPIPDRQLILERTGGSRFALWDASQGMPLAHPAMAGNYHRYALSPSRDQLLTWSGGAVVHAWNLAAQSHYANPRRAITAAVDRDGKAAAYLLNSRTVAVEPLDSRGEMRQFSLDFDASVLQVATNAAFVFLAGSEDARVWRISDGSAGPQLSLNLLKPRDIQLREDGALVISTESPECPSERCDVAVVPFGGIRPKSLPSLPALPQFSPTGNYAVTFRPNLKVLDTRTGQSRIFVVRPGEIVFSRDERYIFVGSEKTPLTLVDLSTGKTQQLGTDPVMQIAAAPNGSSAITVGEDGQFSVWDIATGRLLGNQPGVYFVTSLDFFPGSESLLAASHWWAYMFSTRRTGGTQSSRRLGASWTTRFGMPPGGGTVRALLEPAPNWWTVKELRADGLDIPKLQGDPSDLKKLWQDKLRLRFEAGELVPVDRVRIPRSQ